MRVSLRFRKALQKMAIDLIAAGFNVFPKWVDSKAPAFRKGESYQRYLIEPMELDDDFTKLVMKRFEEDPRVGGIVLACRVGNVVAVDYDVPKVARVHDRILRLVSELGHMVYTEVRAISPGARLGGLHAILSLPTEVLERKRLKVRHGFEAEFAVKTYGLVTISPSLLAEGKILSVYVPLSEATLKDSVYDEDLDVLKRVVEVLGGTLEVVDAREGRYEVPHSPGESYHKVYMGDGRFVGSDRVWLFLRSVAEYTRCEGLARIVDSLEKGEPFPVPYFIYSNYVPDCNHNRSSWTIVENAVFRILAEAGVSEEAYNAVVEAFKRSEDLYAKLRGPVDHESTEENARRARNFKEHGHDRSGACVLKLVGLCGREDCDSCLAGLVRSSLMRDAIVASVKRAVRG